MQGAGDAVAAANGSSLPLRERNNIIRPRSPNPVNPMCVVSTAAHPAVPLHGPVP